MGSDSENPACLKEGGKEGKKEGESSKRDFALLLFRKPEITFDTKAKVKGGLITDGALD